MRLVAVAPNPSIDRLVELDRLTRDAINRPRAETLVAGGKGLNVARAAAALGGQVAAVGLLAGHAGRWIAETLAGEGIAGRFAWTSGETRSCLAIHDTSDDSLTEINEAGPEVAPDAWASFLAVYREELTVGQVGLTTISGSLPPGAPTDGLARLAEVATELGIPVGLDAGGPALLVALGARPWLVKLNAAEAGQTLGRDRPGDARAAADAARDIAGRTGGTVIVTLGLEGAVAVAPDGSGYRVAATAVRGPFPVGSGDAFLAGFAVATLRGGGVVDALRLAAAAAAANALRPGAGRLDPAEVEGSIEAIRVDPLAD